jgi:hypothetical protein
MPWAPGFGGGCPPSSIGKVPKLAFRPARVWPGTRSNHGAIRQSPEPIGAAIAVRVVRAG